MHISACGVDPDINLQGSFGSRKTGKSDVILVQNLKGTSCCSVTVWGGIKYTSYTNKQHYKHKQYFTCELHISESEYQEEIRHTLRRRVYTVKNTLSPYSVDYDINITLPTGASLTAGLDTDGDNEILWDSDRSCFSLHIPRLRLYGFKTHAFLVLMMF